jgi:hypothetical protein
VSGQVETRLPYREFVSKDIHILHPSKIVGEREWIIVISATVRWFYTSILSTVFREESNQAPRQAERTSFTVYHVG